MAVTENYFTGDGSTTSYVLTFEYIDEDDVKVSLDGSVTTAYSFANATTILFNSAPASAVAIRIYRDTDIDELKSTFFAGSSIRAQDLNQNFEQNNFAVQEIKNYTWDNETDTIHSDETWVSSDTQIATTAAMDARFQDEVNDTLTKAELAALSDVIPDNDDAIPTTGAVKDYVDHVIETDILVDGTGLNKTGASGQVTIGISAGSVDLDRIKPADIVDSTETWSATNTQVATTQAIEDRIDEIITNDIGTDGTGITVTDDGDGTITLGLANNSIDLARIKNADIITSGETDPDNDVTIATTAKIGDMIDVAITNDITSNGSGITVTDDGDGTITLSVEAGALNLNRINAGNIVTQSEQDGGATENDTTIFTTLAAAKRFDTLVQTANPGLDGSWETGKTWLQNDDDLTLSVWNGTGWVAITSGGTFTSQPNVVYVDVASGDNNNNGHRISTPKASIKSAIEQINGEISLSTTVADGFNGGSGYVDAVYSNVSLTHSSGTGIGTGLTASITVSSGAVTAITLSAAQQTNLEEYSIGDVLTASNADLGGSGSGLLIPITGAGDGQIVVVSAGVYQEIAPIQIKRRNVSIIGQALRSCIVHPTQATETNNLFELNSGSYLSSMTFTGIKAGTGTGNTFDATLPTTQGWNAAFYSGAFITKSPYIQNCTNFSDSEIDNSDLRAHRPRGGAAGDTDSAPTGGGLLVNGATPATSSPLRSMVCDSYTHVALNGPGILVVNNGYAQCTSSYAFFNKYHIKCLNGGQANLAASTTDFGDQALVADGRSTTAIFTSNVDGAVTRNVDNDPPIISFNINQPTADASWFGSATRPQSNMLVEVTHPTEGTVTYPVLSATANTDSEGGNGWTVTISRPNTNNRSINDGLEDDLADDAAVSFFLRSQIASSGHTMEYVGSGTNYSALPENGGVPVDANQIVESNNGKVWTAITDHNGKFSVGDFFTADQRTGFVSFSAGSVAFDVVTDPTPQLGGDLDVNGNEITSASNGNVVINPNGTGNIVLDANVGIGTAIPDTLLHLSSATGSSSPTPTELRIATTTNAQDWSQSDPWSRLSFYNNDNTAPDQKIHASIDAVCRYTSGYNSNLIFNLKNDSGVLSPVLTMLANGNVGIGTESPSAPLQVQGSAGEIRIQRPTASQSDWSMKLTSSSGEYQIYDNNNTTARLTIDSSGNVGIGTTAPVSRLDLSGGNGGTLGAITFAQGNATNKVSTVIGTSVNANEKGIAINTYHYEDINAVTITSDGKVGIKQLSPSASLDVATARAATVDAAIFGTTGTGVVNDVARILIKNVNTLGGQNQGVGIGGVLAADASNDAHLTFYSNSGGLQERARIDSSGRLLVGTSTARSVGGVTGGLHLTGTAADACFNISRYTNGTGSAILEFGKSRGTSDGSYTIVSDNDELGNITFSGSDGTDLNSRAASIVAFVDGTPGADDMPGRLVFATTADGASSPTERMRIGNTGLITSSPTFTNATAAAANMHCASGGLFYRSTSSIKYKTDVETIEDTYADALLNCRPVWYRSICSGDNPDYGYWGFIAEEVAEIDPRLVHWKTIEVTYDENGSAVEAPCDPEPEGVQYDRFVPHLLNLIKRQKEQIEAMEARLSALEAQ